MQSPVDIFVLGSCLGMAERRHWQQTTEEKESEDIPLTSSWSLQVGCILEPRPQLIGQPSSFWLLLPLFSPGNSIVITQPQGIAPFLVVLSKPCPHLSISSLQFSRSVVSNSLRPHESQHARPPCPSPTPRVHSDSRPFSQ